MARFPLFLELSDCLVLLVGNGPQTDDKLEKLRPFRAKIRRLEQLSETDLEQRPALVIAGDLSEEDSQRISVLCMERNIPVNIVDVPRLCSFYFPALIQEGPLTVAVSTGGASPAAAALLKQRIQSQIPDHCGDILNWLGTLRGQYSGKILKAAVVKAFELERPLRKDELENLE